MKQLTQRLKDGEMSVLEVPAPVLGSGMVRVRTHYSLISAGTEGSTVRAARKSLLGKARERPQQVRQVIDTLKAQGPVQTYRAVMKKLDAYSPLGYSAAGTVIETAPDVTGFAAGDKVACAGLGYAAHAEVLAVPKNLCVRLPVDADLSRASYNTLGAIALQGVRQAELALGETCLVIGLGLLGQLTCLLLRASGVRVVGADIDERMVNLAAAHAADHAFLMVDPRLGATIAATTAGIGADAAIITAATSSLEPVNLAGSVLRKRGTVVVVGDVPTGFERDPHYYRKELTLRMSCSYGPGRYDPRYEEGGQDYPAGYVRWTENRNMAAFQELLASGTVDLDYLTTHRFALEEAKAAYDLVMERGEPFLGILIEYDVAAAPGPPRVQVGRGGAATPPGRLGVSFVGAGSYAMSHLLPNLPDEQAVGRIGVLTASGTSSRSVAERFGFDFCTASEAELYDDGRTGVVFVATRHDSHARYVSEALRRGCHVFVEKPLCLESGELDAIAELYAASRHSSPRPELMVGFNRRFAPLATKMKDALGGGPIAATYRVNAGQIPADSWIQDPAIGGGRIVGEVCHFVDFLVWLTGSLPESVHASALRGSGGVEDTLSVNLSFADGSIGTVCYYCNGARTLAKERVEVYSAGMTAVLDDFRLLELHTGAKPKSHKLLSQDKGQAHMVRAFFGALAAGHESPLPFEQIHAVTAATFAIRDSLSRSTSVVL